MGAGIEGRLVGTAVFKPAQGGLRCDEQGTLTFGAYCGSASRRLLFKLTRPDAASVQFADGRPFHDLDLSSGLAEISHLCDPDIYRGRYRAAGFDRWTVTWLIDGPRKRLRMGTRYARIDPIGITR